MAGLPWSGLLALSAAAFTDVMTDLLPAGLLPQMSSALQVPEERIGLLVGAFAVASCLAAIPVTAALRGLPAALRGLPAARQAADRAAAREPVAEYEEEHGSLPAASRQRARQFLIEAGLRELAQHCGHADILREQLITG